MVRSADKNGKNCSPPAMSAVQLVLCAPAAALCQLVGRTLAPNGEHEVFKSRAFFHKAQFCQVTAQSLGRGSASRVTSRWRLPPSAAVRHCAAPRRPWPPGFPGRCAEQQQPSVRASTVRPWAFAENKICSEAAAILVVPVKRAAYADKLPANGGVVAVSSSHPALAEWSSLKTNDYSLEQAAGVAWNGNQFCRVQRSFWCREKKHYSYKLTLWKEVRETGNLK